MTNLDVINSALNAERLFVLGGFHEDNETILMVGPDETNGFWAHFQASVEGQDGLPDAMDRWSSRVLGSIATGLDAKVYFPFGGPPYHPFYNWAIKTGRIHESPIRLLVHDQAGLWVSFRGALQVSGRLGFPPPPPSPCEACVTRPCLSACPAHVLDEHRYDVAGCKTFLRSGEGRDCMGRGCHARRDCPVSKSWGRKSEQSAFHMEAFCPR